MASGDRPRAEEALAAAGVSVSRETIERLIGFVDLLREWQRRTNLVGPAALSEIWTRHVADSAELIRFAPSARSWLDLGSGAGFPGLVMATLLAGDSDASVILVESNAKKAAFLREVARALDLPAAVENARIEDVVAGITHMPDAISARALAPVGQLVEWIEPLLVRAVPAYLHKGLDFAREWAAFPHRERFVLVQHASRIGPGVIVELRADEPTLKRGEVE